jgi:hypothetical protein
MSTARGGISTAPESAQLRVVNSHRARMLLPGVADLDTLRYCSGPAGSHEQAGPTGQTSMPVGPRSRGTRL